MKAFYSIRSLLWGGLLPAFLISPVGYPGSLEAGTGAEYRGLWVDAWREGIKSEDEVEQLIADARAGNFNLILPNVRRYGDVFYQSDVEPKAAELESGFDPLEAMIRHARKEDPPIQVHPWVVTYPLWHRQHNAPRQMGHVFNQRPDWMTRNREDELWDGRTYVLDPGHPEVQDHLFAIAMELVENYDVDGIHFDYIRYRTPEWGYNEVAVERFNRLRGREGLPEERDPAWMQFRRDEVTALLRRVFLAVKEKNPGVTVSAATITWAPGPATDDDWPATAAHRRVLQNWAAWMEEGILDINMPMAYFEDDRYRGAWERWNRFIKDNRHGRHAAIGVGFFENPVEATLRQIRDARMPTDVGDGLEGVIGFSYRNTNSEGVPRINFLGALTATGHSGGDTPAVFAEPVPVPEAPPLSAEGQGHLRGTVYRSAGGEPAGDARLRISGAEDRDFHADGSGTYGLLGLPAGEYRLTASVPGSGTDGAELSGSAAVTVQAGKVVSRDIVVE